MVAAAIFLLRVSVPLVPPMQSVAVLPVCVLLQLPVVTVSVFLVGLTALVAKPAETEEGRQTWEQQHLINSGWL